MARPSSEAFSIAELAASFASKNFEHINLNKRDYLYFGTATRDAQVYFLKIGVGDHRDSAEAEANALRLLHSQPLTGLRAPVLIDLIHGEVKGTPWIAAVMQKMGDGSLQEAGKMPSRQAYAVLRDLAQTVSQLHSCGFAHGDLAPANIMLDQDGGFAAIVDFEKFSGGKGSAFGTGQFESPEQQASRRQGPHNDLWAMGVLFYGLLTGREYNSKNPNLAKLCRNERKILEKCCDSEADRRPPAAWLYAAFSALHDFARYRWLPLPLPGTRAGSALLQAFRWIRRQRFALTAASLLILIQQGWQYYSRHWLEVETQRWQLAREFSAQLANGQADQVRAVASTRTPATLALHRLNHLYEQRQPQVLGQPIATISPTRALLLGPDGSIYTFESDRVVRAYGVSGIQHFLGTPVPEGRDDVPVNLQLIGTETLDVVVGSGQQVEHLLLSASDGSRIRDACKTSATSSKRFWAASGRYQVLVQGGQIRLCDSLTGQQSAHTLPLPKDTGEVQFSPDLSFAVAQASDGRWLLGNLRADGDDPELLAEAKWLPLSGKEIRPILLGAHPHRQILFQESDSSPLDQRMLFYSNSSFRSAIALELPDGAIAIHAQFASSLNEQVETTILPLAFPSVLPFRWRKFSSVSALPGTDSLLLFRNPNGDALIWDPEQGAQRGPIIYLGPRYAMTRRADWLEIDTQWNPQTAYSSDVPISSLDAFERHQQSTGWIDIAPDPLHALHRSGDTLVTAGPRAITRWQRGSAQAARPIARLAPALLPARHGFWTNPIAAVAGNQLQLIDGRSAEPIGGSASLEDQIHFAFGHGQRALAVTGLQVQQLDLSTDPPVLGEPQALRATVRAAVQSEDGGRVALLQSARWLEARSQWSERLSVWDFDSRQLADWELEVGAEEWKLRFLDHRRLAVWRGRELMVLDTDGHEPSQNWQPLAPQQVLDVHAACERDGIIVLTHAPTRARGHRHGAASQPPEVHWFDAKLESRFQWTAQPADGALTELQACDSVRGLGQTFRLGEQKLEMLTKEIARLDGTLTDTPLWSDGVINDRQQQNAERLVVLNKPARMELLDTRQGVRYPSVSLQLGVQDVLVAGKTIDPAGLALAVAFSGLVFRLDARPIEQAPKRTAQLPEFAAPTPDCRGQAFDQVRFDEPFRSRHASAGEVEMLVDVPRGQVRFAEMEFCVAGGWIPGAVTEGLPLAPVSDRISYQFADAQPVAGVALLASNLRMLDEVPGALPTTTVLALDFVADSGERRTVSLSFDALMLGHGEQGRPPMPPVWLSRRLRDAAQGIHEARQPYFVRTLDSPFGPDTPISRIELHAPANPLAAPVVLDLRLLTEFVDFIPGVTPPLAELDR